MASCCKTSLQIDISISFLIEYLNGVKLMQKIFFSLAAILLLISVVNAQEAPQDVWMAAKAGLPSLLSRIAPGERSDFGFTTDDALDQVY